MELHNIATIRTKDNSFMQFIIGALATSEEYHYNITVLDPPKQYVIDIYEADLKGMGAKLPHIDPEVIRASLTEFENSVAIPGVKPEVVNKIKDNMKEDK
jgi:hypothetical protein